MALGVKELVYFLSLTSVPQQRRRQQENRGRHLLSVNPSVGDEYDREVNQPLVEEVDQGLPVGHMGGPSCVFMHFGIWATLCTPT